MCPFLCPETCSFSFCLGILAHRLLPLITQPLCCPKPKARVEATWRHSVWQLQLVSQATISITASPVSEPLWTSGPGDPWDECSQHLTATLWKTPSENHPAKPNHSTEPWKIIINHCCEALSFKEVCYTAINNWNRLIQFLFIQLIVSKLKYTRNDGGTTMNEEGTLLWEGELWYQGSQNITQYWFLLFKIYQYYRTKLTFPRHALSTNFKFYLLFDLLFKILPYSSPFHSHTAAFCLLITISLQHQYLVFTLDDDISYLWLQNIIAHNLAA